MPYAGRFLVALTVIFSLGLWSAAYTQEGEFVYVVAYLEVDPTSMEEAAELLRQYRFSTRGVSGNLQSEILQRINRPSHFSFVETWQDEASFVAHSSSEYTQALHSALAPHLTSPYDERKHFGLAVTRNAAAGEIFVVTHIDIVPSRKDEGLAFVEAMAKSSHTDPGNVGFYALIQSNRGNHVALVEEWRDEESWQAHVASSHMRSTRQNLLPISGALYDERLFKRL